MSDQADGGEVDNDPSADLKLWTLSKIDIRSPVMPSAWPVARLELSHPTRGRVTDIGTAPGAFDAAFVAASHILGISPRLLSYNVCSAAPDEENSLSIRIDIELQLGEQICRGTCFGVDLVRCSLAAWLEAASRLLSADPNVGAKIAHPTKSRPFQVSAVDQSDNLWIFASDDEKATRIVASKFEKDGFSDLRSLKKKTN